jgi:hypothetical protein
LSRDKSRFLFVSKEAQATMNAIDSPCDSDSDSDTGNATVGIFARCCRTGSSGATLTTGNASAPCGSQAVRQTTMTISQRAEGLHRPFL